jgi:hypothetical protein
MNTEPCSSPVGSNSGYPVTDSSVKIDMVFRLWTSASTGAKSHAAEDASAPRSGVLALIEDAAASRQGVFAAADDHLFVSGLQEPADALVLSRQIQHGMQGFRGKAGVPPVAVSIAIDCNARASSTGFFPSRDASSQDQGRTKSEGVSGAANYAPKVSHDLLTLLTLAKPAQILITHDLWQRGGSLKGLPVKSFPGRFGVYEYLWTAENKLDLLQSEPQLTLSALPPAQPTAPETKEPNATPSPASAAVATNDATTAPQQDAQSASPQKASVLPRPLLFGGIAAAAAVVIAVIGFSFSRAHSSGAAPQNPPIPVQTPPSATIISPAPAPAKPQVASAPAPLRSKPPAASTIQKKSAKQSPAEAAPVAEEKPAATPAPAQPCLLPGDINKYVGLAEADRERGDYGNAVRIFRQVLACDPNNAAAREGLNRAIQGQQQSRY